MLKKLIKHEFKDTMRLFIPMFGFIVVLTPIFSLMMSLGSQPYDENTADALSLVFGSGIIGYCLLLFGLLIVTQVLIAIRFYKTMTSQEAYLTFTLQNRPAFTCQMAGFLCVVYPRLWNCIDFYAYRCVNCYTNYAVRNHSWHWIRFADN